MKKIKKGSEKEREFEEFSIFPTFQKEGGWGERERDDLRRIYFCLFSEKKKKFNGVNYNKINEPFFLRKNNLMSHYFIV